MNTRLLITAAALCLASTPAIAQTQSDDIVVTGHPIIEENAVDVFGSLSTVVTAEQISDLNAIDLSSALRRSPGVVVSRFNPVGSFGGDEGGAIYIRGFGASRPGSEIRTYIDGAPFYMGVWNHPLLDLLPVGGIDALTIYKGPQPQIYLATRSPPSTLPRTAQQQTVRRETCVFRQARSRPLLNNSMQVVVRRISIGAWRKAMPNQTVTAKMRTVNCSTSWAVLVIDCSARLVAARDVALCR